MTLAEIARELKVSPSTVSRVLNGYSKNFGANPEMRARILEMVEKTGYRPNPVFRSIRAKKNRQIAFSFYSRSLRQNGETVDRALDEATRILEENGFTFHYLFHPRARVECYPVPEWKVAGMVIPDVIDPAMLRLIEEHRCPYVTLNGVCGEAGSAVMSDEPANIRMVMEYLYRLGHRRIAYLSAPVSRVSLSERLAGAVGAFARCGLEIDGRLGIIPGAETVNVQEMNGSQQEFVRNWLRGQLNGPLPPTAVFCSNDTLAVTVCRMLEEYKIRVPDEVSVVGFDNINLGAWLPVPLTTVAHDFYRIGRLAGSILLKRRQGGDPMPLQYRVPPELIVRGSTCAVRA